MSDSLKMDNNVDNLTPQQAAVSEKKDRKSQSAKPTQKVTKVEAQENAQGEQTPAHKVEEKETVSSLLTQEGLEGGLKIKRAKGSKNVHSGICHILATFNNTKVTFSDAKGNVLSWSSSGRCNFKGSRKSTAYAAQVVTTEAGKVALGHGLKEVHVYVKGPGMGRDAAIRTLQTLGLSVIGIKDVTPVPHNGCRPPKRRRV